MALDPGGNGLGRGLLGGDGAGPGQTTSVVRLDFLPPSGRRLVVVRVRRTRVDLGGLGELNPGRHCHGLDGAAAMTDVGRRLLPAVAHVDGTTRPQAIDPSETSPFASIVLEMGRRGVPAVLNTSFNGPGEPIIQTATEALSAFRAQQLDFLVLDDKVVTT